MKRSLLLLLVICYSSVYAQELAEGFIVKTSGDTVRGFIRERFEWSNIPAMEIASSPTSELAKIPSDEVNNFYLNKYNSYFFRRILDIDKKPVDITRLERTPLRVIVKDTIVIRRLVKGRVTLYDYIDENAKKHFYIQKDEGNIEELAYARYLARSGSTVVDQPFFVEPLKNMLSDCNKVGNVSPNYEEKPLKKVITQYNSCFNQGQPEEKPQQEVTQAKATVGVTIFAGAGFGSPHFRGESLNNNASSPDPNNANFSSTSVVVAGVGFEIISARKSRLVPGFQVEYLKTGTSKAEQNLVTSTRAEEMSLSAATVSVSLKYVFIEKGKLTFYVKATGGVQSFLSGAAKYTTTDNALKTTTQGNFANFNKYGWAYSIGAGFRYDRLSLEIGFQENIAPTHLPATDFMARAVVSTLAAKVGFCLTKN